ncbi:MAG: hypothetical protein KAH25_07650 [Bacteroidales bacterium]|nr:hypothetical protein [Bacteroidales bacterium]
MITDFLEKYSTRKNILIGIGFIIFINVIAFPLFPMLFSDSNIIAGKILDIQFGFMPIMVQELLFSMTEKGRHIYYLSTIIIDIPYAITYGFVYSFLIIFLLKKQKDNKLNKRTCRMLVFTPFLITLFDLIENGGILYFITSYPQINPTVVGFISLSNQLKWIMAGLSFIIIMYLSLSVFIRSKKR